MVIDGVSFFILGSKVLKLVFVCFLNILFSLMNIVEWFIILM